MQQKTGQNYIFVDFTVQFRRVKNMRQLIELLHLSKIVHNFYQTSIIGTLNQKHKGKRVIKNHYQINDKLIEPKILNNHDLQKTQNQNVYVENYKYIHNGTIREKYFCLYFLDTRLMVVVGSPGVFAQFRFSFILLRTHQYCNVL